MNQLRPADRTASGLRLRLLRLAMALGLVSVLWACNAPFIPVPPPGQTTSFTSQLVDDGAGGQKAVWIAHGKAGQAPSLAQVEVFNDTRGTGVIGLAMDDGSYVSPVFDGVLGDRVEISYTTGDVRSQSVCFQLMEGEMAPRCNPP